MSLYVNTVAFYQNLASFQGKYFQIIGSHRTEVGGVALTNQCPVCLDNELTGTSISHLIDDQGDAVKVHAVCRPCFQSGAEYSYNCPLCRFTMVYERRESDDSEPENDTTRPALTTPQTESPEESLYYDDASESDEEEFVVPFTPEQGVDPRDAFAQVAADDNSDLDSEFDQVVPNSDSS